MDCVLQGEARRLAEQGHNGYAASQLKALEVTPPKSGVCFQVEGTGLMPLLHFLQTQKYSPRESNSSVAKPERINSQEVHPPPTSQNRLTPQEGCSPRPGKTAPPGREDGFPAQLCCP